ncbi:hypothetical protein AMTRI_Chr09g15530 [Amborella trichopoda]
MDILSSSTSPLFVLLQLVLLITSDILSAEGKTANGKIPAIYVIGDSIVDSGNNNDLITLVKCNFPPYGKDFKGHKPTGRFCNGKIGTDYIASGLGVKELLPAYLDPNVQIQDLITGVSFASGGSGFDDFTPQFLRAIPLGQQVEFLKECFGKVERAAGRERADYIKSNGIFFVVAGSNDLVNNYFALPTRRAQMPLDQYLYTLVQKASNIVQKLYKIGGRRIYVLGLPPLGCVPIQRTLRGGAARKCVEEVNQASIAFNAKLSTQLHSLALTLPNATVIYVEIFDILLDMIQNPSRYGFEESRYGCCGTGGLETAVLCNSVTSSTCRDASKYVFWDSFHPTERASSILASQLLHKYFP